MRVTSVLGMLGLKSTMVVADNSGGLIATVIDVCRKKAFSHATVGDEVTVVIKRARPIADVPKDAPLHVLNAQQQRVRRGDVKRAVIVRTRKEILRPDGRKIRFDDNACVLLNFKGEMLASRVNGIVGAELKKSGRWGKLLSMAPKVL
ncbi:ribosomal protein L14 [Mrakia frigida]|uniref:mitochondrial 54S ribosomal protein uL14m MRPL38 n=1 Tax=Mrakia frigida TaxID=29902 RepID=UPI003FCC1434